MPLAALKLNIISVIASANNIHVDALTTDMAMLVEGVPRQVQASGCEGYMQGPKVFQFIPK